MYPLDLKKYTFLDVLNCKETVVVDNCEQNVKDLLLSLILSGLYQICNYHDDKQQLVKITLTKDVITQYEKLSETEKQNRDNPIATKYKNLSNIDYLMTIAENSLLRMLNTLHKNKHSFGVNTSGQYNNKFTVQSMIEIFEQDATVLQNFLKRLKSAYSVIYPITRDENNVIIKNPNINMFRDVSGLLTLVNNTYKKYYATTI